MKVIDRNIYLHHGHIRVAITRRPNTVIIKRCKSVAEAIKYRDWVERNLPAHKPWGICGRRVEKQRTTQDLRMERRAKNLCQVCGDVPPKPGRVTCQSCLTWQNDKRKNARLTAKTIL